MAGFDLDSYVDVAERITEFYARYENGRLVSDEAPSVVTAGGKDFVVLHARAYRSPDDLLPGDGWAWEPVPGPTQFTKDSELMNVQTAAWGRAIVALGFATKKIASAQEVRNRQQPTAKDSGGVDVLTANSAAPAVTVEPDPPPNGSPFTTPALREQPTDGGDPLKVVITFGKYKDKTIGQMKVEKESWLHWVTDPSKFEPKTAEQRRIVGAAAIALGMAVPVAAGDGAPVFDDSDVPF